jgi:hypothetical protein
MRFHSAAFWRPVRGYKHADTLLGLHPGAFTSPYSKENPVYPGIIPNSWDYSIEATVAGFIITNEQPEYE